MIKGDCRGEIGWCEWKGIGIGKCSWSGQSYGTCLHIKRTRLAEIEIIKISRAGTRLVDGAIVGDTAYPSVILKQVIVIDVESNRLAFRKSDGSESIIWMTSDRN